MQNPVYIEEHCVLRESILQARLFSERRKVATLLPPEVGSICNFLFINCTLRRALLCLLERKLFVFFLFHGFFFFYYQVLYDRFTGLRDAFAFVL